MSLENLTLEVMLAMTALNSSWMKSEDRELSPGNQSLTLVRADFGKQCGSQTMRVCVCMPVCVCMGMVGVGTCRRENVKKIQSFTCLRCEERHRVR